MSKFKVVCNKPETFSLRLKNLYFWTVIPYYNINAITHIHTHGKWFESVLCSKGRRLQQKLTVNYKKTPLIAFILQQHLTSPLTWTMRRNLSRVNIIYRHTVIYIGKAWEGDTKSLFYILIVLTVVLPVRERVVGWSNVHSVSEVAHSYHIQHPFY